MRIRIAALVLMALASSAAAFAQRSAAQAAPPLLFVYESADPKIEAWVSLFREELKARNLAADFVLPEEAARKDLSAYREIVVYGAVQAFANIEPVRDWLKTKVDLSGKEVHLFVTANQWSLDGYFKQLKKLLLQRKADTVDAVSSATKKLDDAAKRKLVRDFVAKL